MHAYKVMCLMYRGIQIVHIRFRGNDKDIKDGVLWLLHILLYYMLCFREHHDVLANSLITHVAELKLYDRMTSYDIVQKGGSQRITIVNPLLN